MIRKIKNKCLLSSKTNTVSQTPIRVLYKKVGQPPEVKIIKNLYKLKKTIIQKNLDIFPYEKLIILCHSNKSKIPMRPNIFLPLRRIVGDLIVVKIDKKTRQFQSLSQEDILWFSKALISKSAKNTKINSQIKIHHFPFEYERSLDNNKYTSAPSFEKTLISVLLNLELILSTILKNNGDKR